MRVGRILNAVAFFVTATLFIVAQETKNVAGLKLTSRFLLQHLDWEQLPTFLAPGRTEWRPIPYISLC